MSATASAPNRPNIVIMVAGGILVALVAIVSARLAYGLILPPMRDDLGLSYRQAGTLGTVTALGYLLFVLLGGFWNTGISVALVLAFHLWITGAFHEDGLADSVDALGGGYTVARRLEIMKDSRIGTYGTVALIMALGLKGLLLAEAKTVWLALLLSPVVSRLTPLWLMRFLPYVTDPNTSKSKPVAEGFSTQRLCVATALTVVVAALAGAVIPALLSVVVVALLWGGYLWRHLRGYTGDTLGASVVLCELVFLLLWG